MTGHGRWYGEVEVNALGAIGPEAKDAVKPLEEMLADKGLRDRTLRAAVQSALKKIK